MNIFRRNKQNNFNPVHADHKLYIFALSGPDTTTLISGLVPIEIYTVHEGETINKDTDFIAPVITTDGNIVFLPIGKENALLGLQTEIRNIATKQLRAENISDVSVGSFAVVGTSFHLPDTPNISCNVYRVLVYQKLLPEFGQIYSYLKTYCEKEDARPKIQSYFTQDLQKKWINNVISGLKQRLNWNALVDEAIKEAYKEADKHEKVNEEKVRWVSIDGEGKLNTKRR